MNNVILIGMPGAGKSTVGVVLAKRLGWRFLDSDLVIQEKCGKLLYQLIEERGEAGFLMLENEVNRNIKGRRMVVATGGSAVYGKEAMAHFREIGRVVVKWQAEQEFKDPHGVQHEHGGVFRQGSTLRDLYEERILLYEKYAEITVDCGGRNIRSIVEEIAGYL